MTKFGLGKGLGALIPTDEPEDESIVESLNRLAAEPPPEKYNPNKIDRSIPLAEVAGLVQKPNVAAAVQNDSAAQNEGPPLPAAVTQVFNIPAAAIEPN